jgi:DNA-binding NtrC family response regulator
MGFEDGYRIAQEDLRDRDAGQHMPEELTSFPGTAGGDLPCEQVIFGCSAAMRAVRSKVELALDRGYSVVIQGEPGSGKELVARFLHAHSGRHDATFVKLNCGATSFTMLEDAVLNKAFALRGIGQTNLKSIANCETLFLDGFGELDRRSQDLMIDLLQNLRRVCSESIDAKAAFPQVVFAMTPDGSDISHNLFLGWETVWLRLPSVRDRKEDIRTLSAFFVEKLSRRFGKEPRYLSETTLQILGEWHWPGNLRELENWIARVMILGNEEEQARDLGRQIALRRGRMDRGGAGRRGGVGPEVDAQSAALKGLQLDKWSRRRMAEELRVSYRTLLGFLRDKETPRRRRSHRNLPPS